VKCSLKNIDTEVYCITLHLESDNSQLSAVKIIKFLTELDYKLKNAQLSFSSCVTSRNAFQIII
jgi:hypothetical protein